MTKTRSTHRCAACGATPPRWTGRCPQCGEWGSLEPVVVTGASASLGDGARPVPLDGLDVASQATWPTGIGELDRVLGGGFVPGSVTLLGGEPGIGKSTLVLQTLASMAKQGRRCLVVSAEESASQVKRRATRLGADLPGVWLLPETHMGAVRAASEELQPEVVVVDSIQTVWDRELESPPGSLTQVRGCAQDLVTMAKTSGAVAILVGHVTKEGTLAGPRVLEHLVDTVLSFEGDRDHSLRMLRAVKHRFGATGELGLFEMGDGGLVDVPDPSGLFLGDRRPDASGSAVAPVMEGQRPLLLEIQALIGSTSPSPRRSVLGLDPGRVAMLLAVLDRRAGIPAGARDVYASAVGGVRVVEPAADLALCLALASSFSGRPVRAGLVAVGEVGLGGELRRVGHLSRRLAEAARLGHTTAVVPASVEGDHPLEVVRAGTLAEAVELVLGAPPGRGGAPWGAPAHSSGAAGRGRVTPARSRFLDRPRGSAAPHR